MTETTVSAVRLSGRLPKGELNGLADLADDLVGKPERVRYVVCTVRVQKTTTVHSDHQAFPMLEIMAVEAITNVDDRQSVEDAMRAAYRERTGTDELPLDSDAVPSAEREAAAAEQHLADNPDSVLAGKS